MSSGNEYTVVFVRHGESVWNKENKFTGWTDVELSEKGLMEAKSAGKALIEGGYKFDIAYTSVLKRAIETLSIIQKELDQNHIEVTRDYRLNERHYGALQGRGLHHPLGLNKSETAAKYGEDQVKIWRRSYDIPPPELDRTDPRWPGNSPIYESVPKDSLPLCESLKCTVKRVLPLWKEVIVPQILSGKHVLISAHGNSIRALIMFLEKISEAEIVELNIPTGIPLVVKLDGEMKFVKKWYLASVEDLAAAQKSVAEQGKSK